MYVADDGARDVRGRIYHSAATSENLSLNPDGFQHAISGLDAERDSLKIGFEDLRGGGDQDFNDLLFSVDLGAANARLLDPATVAGDIQIEDVDGSTLVEARVAFSSGWQDGDFLYIAEEKLETVDGETRFKDSGIQVEVVEDPEGPMSLRLSGEASHDAYENALGSVRFASDSEEIYGGDREIQFSVVDPHGAASELASVRYGVGGDSPPVESEAEPNVANMILRALEEIASREDGGVNGDQQNVAWLDANLGDQAGSDHGDENSWLEQGDGEGEAGDDLWGDKRAEEEDEAEEEGDDLPDPEILDDPSGAEAENAFDGIDRQHG